MLVPARIEKLDPASTEPPFNYLVIDHVQVDDQGLDDRGNQIVDAMQQVCQERGLFFLYRSNDSATGEHVIVVTEQPTEEQLIQRASEELIVNLLDDLEQQREDDAWLEDFVACLVGTDLMPRKRSTLRSNEVF